jgi:4-diphosphocytidyl-2-C-methyl-D-erythritol kinase
MAGERSGGYDHPGDPVNVHEAPAKVNLVLRVGRERPDGYHDVVSLMARIDLVDVLMVAPAARTSVTCPDIPGGDTLVTRALHAFRHAARHHGGFHVGIAKRIPIGAGLGGGSSDAAAALRAANGLVDDPLDEAELTAVAAEIGADVPFFLGPPVAIARGRGDVCTPGPALPSCGLVVAHPGRPLMTRDVYAAYAPRNHLEQSIPAPETLEDLAELVENDLAEAAERLEPRCAALREGLVARGARAAAVTGSGSAVFGLFATLDEAEAAARDLPGAAWARAATLSRT